MQKLASRRFPSPCSPPVHFVEAPEKLRNLYGVKFWSVPVTTRNFPNLNPLRSDIYDAILGLGHRSSLHLPPVGLFIVYPRLHGEVRIILYQYTPAKPAENQTNQRNFLRRGTVLNCNVCSELPPRVRLYVIQLITKIYILGSNRIQSNCPMLIDHILQLID